MLNLWLQAFEDVDGIDTLFAEMEELVQYIRNHDKPRAILASFASKGLVRSVPTRFASKFLVMFRVIELRPALAQCVSSPQWGEYEKGLKGAADKAAAKTARDRIQCDRFWCKLEKLAELGHTAYGALRIFDQDGPTGSIFYQTMLDLEAKCSAWEAKKWHGGGFSKAGPDKCTLLTKQSKMATGKGAAPWTIAECLAYRWRLQHEAGSGMGGKLLSAAFALHPRSFDVDAARTEEVGGDLLDVAAHLRPSQADAIAAQWEDFKLQNPSGPLFYGPSGTKLPACEAVVKLEAARDWWFDLPRAKKAAWPDLRELAMEVENVWCVESAAERFYSQVQISQSNQRAGLGLELTGDLAFARVEILADTADRCREYRIDAARCPSGLEFLDTGGGTTGSGAVAPPAHAPPPLAGGAGGVLAGVPGGGPGDESGGGDTDADDPPGEPSFCGTCGRRNDANRSTTHASTGGLEAFCTC